MYYFFLVTVYFKYLRKNPCIILNNHEFRFKSRQGAKTRWVCVKDTTEKCRVQIYTFSNCLVVRGGSHLHPPTFTGCLHDYKSQIVNITHSWWLVTTFSINYYCCCIIDDNIKVSFCCNTWTLSDMSIYIAHGRKNPILILNDYEFKVETRTAEKSYWCCKMKNKYRCKCRLLSWGSTLYIKSSVDHCHPPPDCDSLPISRKPHKVNVKYVNNFKNT